MIQKQLSFRESNPYRMHPCELNDNNNDFDGNARMNGGDNTNNTSDNNDDELLDKELDID